MTCIAGKESVMNFFNQRRKNGGFYASNGRKKDTPPPQSAPRPVKEPKYKVVGWKYSNPNLIRNGVNESKKVRVNERNLDKSTAEWMAANINSQGGNVRVSQQ
jgi:hypothetical protein